MTERKFNPLDPLGLFGGGPPNKAQLADNDIYAATELIFDTVGIATANIFAGLSPIYRTFSSLSSAEKEQAFQGLKGRIRTEGLQGYVNRKRQVWGDKATEAVINALKRRNWW